LACGPGILLSRDAAAQTKHDVITTKSGVYSVQQAVRGRDVYAGYCKSCHTVQTHTGAAFNATWNGRALSELYDYMSERMPKNEPGSLSSQEYADVLAYVLRMNAMPAGDHELPVESAAMQKIRIDLTKISVRKEP
jgi:mono/diheme cytochrome c family protein